ncbi:DNA translocase FtsK [Rhodobacteraceae bacterium IMCC15231]|nr:DNA translocase FtsK [Rhodobacteraceae bacterium IMCC15231]
MAYPSARVRPPIFDSALQAALERRAVEFLGLGLLVLSALTAMMFTSYAPEDPSWLSASDAPVQNILGSLGAMIAAPIMLIFGLSAWSLVAIQAVWGLRCLLHRGAHRALGRLIFAPFGVAVFAIYAAGLVPPASWSNNFGLGGLFGDTVLKTLLRLSPLPAQPTLTYTSFATGITLVLIGLYCLGASKRELGYALRFLRGGLLQSGRAVASGVGRGSMRLLAARNQQADASAPSDIIRRGGGSATFVPQAPSEFSQDLAVPHKEVKRGLFSRLPGFVKREEDPSHLEPPLNSHTHSSAPAGPEDRLQARISDAVKSRLRVEPAFEDAASEAQSHVFQPQDASLEGAAGVPSQFALGEPLLTGLRREPQLSADRSSQVFQTEGQALVSSAGDEDAQPLYPEPEYGEQDTNLSLRSAIPRPEARTIVHPPLKVSQAQSARAQQEAQPSLKFEDPKTDFELPPLGLLASPISVARHQLSDESLEENARLLESVLDDYGVKGDIVSVRPGPVVTMYELEPAPGLKASRVIGLSDDIARSMSALSARVSTVPGRSIIGIELPNDIREKVVLREILSAKAFGDSSHRLPLALGKDISGEPMVTNLAKMPHLLIAGTTGSGKSVAINTMILSLLYKLTPDECRMIMIDPKMLELSVYDGIPHLLSPVVTDPKKAVVALKWVVGEMEERYRKMSKMGVRNIDGYNGRVAYALGKNEMFSRTIQTGFDDATGEPVFETEEFLPEKMPYIVVIVDEMADLMMVAGKEIEACIQRLAQMARASGIHLIMATQRPSVDVITGTIKANFPTRISFQVTSKIDSRTILGEMGAEQLLGMGDMLYMAGGSKITRCHGPFVSDTEVEEVVSHLKSFGPPDYKSGVVEGPDDDKSDSIDLVLGLTGASEGEDVLYDQAVAIVLQDRKCSTSYIQRKLAIGYNKAARLVEQMEEEGLVSPANHVGKRDILVPEQP